MYAGYNNNVTKWMGWLSGDSDNIEGKKNCLTY